MIYFNNRSNGYSWFRPSFQTSLHKLYVKLAQMFIVKSVSPPNIGKVLENDMLSDP